MTGRRSTVSARPSDLRILGLASCLAAVVCLVSCATAGRTSGRDQFPLDPREDLTGPFPSGVEKGWRELLEGDPVRALAAFEGAAKQPPRLAADIGRIEAIVLQGRAKDAISLCEEILSAGEPTPSLLVACGEAQFRSGHPTGAFSLYRRALARVPDRAGLVARAEELRIAARDQLLESARAAAEARKWKEARSEMARALEIAPESPAVHAAAGDIESAGGEKEKALRLYREALDLGGQDLETAEKEGNLALELGDHALAISVFDALAKQDPRFAARAEEARLAFRVANWPRPERQAARSARLTRAGAATLVWWMYPEIRESRVAGGVVASDVLSRRDSRALTRAVALGLLDVDRDTHRASPDAHLSASACARLLLRLLLVVTPVGREVPCLGESRRPPRAAAQAIEAAQKCGLLPEGEPVAVSGRLFTSALDRVRALAKGPEASNED